MLSDDPRLTARDDQNKPLSRQPLRVIVDSRARTPLSARLVNEPGATLIAVADPDRKKVAALDRSGLEVLPVPGSTHDEINLSSLLAILGKRGVVRLMVEGGGTLLGSLFDHALIDKVFAFHLTSYIRRIKCPFPN